MRGVGGGYVGAGMAWTGSYGWSDGGGREELRVEGVGSVHDGGVGVEGIDVR